VQTPEVYEFDQVRVNTFWNMQLKMHYYKTSALLARTDQVLSIAEWHGSSAHVRM